MALKTYLENLLVEGKIKEALNIMREIGDTQASDFSRNVIFLLARYNLNQSAYEKGTLSHDHFKIESNKLLDVVQNMIGSDLEEDKIPAELLKKATNADGGGSAGQITINKSITVPSDFKGGIVQNVIPSDLKVVTTAVEFTSILFAAANPSDEARLATDREYRTIREQMQLGSRRDAFRFFDPQFAVGINALIRAFGQKPDILHFAGHGKERGITITNDQNKAVTINEAVLTRLFKPLRGHTKLVLFNSCYSAEQARLISTLDMYVIGYNAPVGDNAAINFAEGFYAGLSEGKNYQDAFNDAMTVILTEYPDDAGSVEVWHNGEMLPW